MSRARAMKARSRKPRRDDRNRGNEAPMVITPGAVVRLVRQTVALVRKRKRRAP